MVAQARAAHAGAGLVVAQLLLGGVFAAALATLLVILGDVALTADTMTAWIGHAPEPFMLGRSALSVTVDLLKAPAFLAMISALTFVISAVSDEHREHFFDPILQEVRRALLVDSARRGDQRNR